MSAAELVQYFDMAEHPEGGFFKQTYISETIVVKDALPAIYPGGRAICSAIYFLVLPGNFSAFHRLRGDELWHFYAGGCLHLHVIHPNGKYELKKLGGNIKNEEQFQLLIAAGCWFAAECAPGGVFSFTGCTMAPGFDFADFELAKKDELSAQYPEHHELINRLCRQ